MPILIFVCILCVKEGEGRKKQKTKFNRLKGILLFRKKKKKNANIVGCLAVS